MRKVAIHRPGALGDVFMIMNSSRQLREKYDEIHLFCHKTTSSIIGEFLSEHELVDSIGDPSLLRREDYDQVVTSIGYPVNEGYPNARIRKHLIHLFADELGVEITFDELVLKHPYFPINKVDKTPYITIQNKTGWSIYREWWGFQDLIEKIRIERPEIGIYQIGGPDDPPLVNIDGSFLGDSFKDNVAAQCWSQVHVGLDSVYMHTSNILWQGIGKKNCVILFGATQHDASGYPHNTNISLEMQCRPCFRENPWISEQSKGICPHPPNQTYEKAEHECMANITVDMVYDAMVELLDKDYPKY